MNRTPRPQTYYAIRNIQGGWFVELFDDQGAAMGIMAKGTRPATFLNGLDAANAAAGKGLRPIADFRG